MIASQLGKSVEEAYASFDEAPLASASLGQVHRAVTHGGEAVAVKVQYPDIARALKADLDNLGSMVSVFASTTRMAHGKAYYAELRESMMDELDYRQEAARARMFAKAAAPLAEVRVPRSFDELTSEKVLTAALVEPPLAATLAMVFSRDVRVMICEGRRLARTASMSMRPASRVAACLSALVAGTPER